MNIYDLAREAGVSIATASKALNGRKDVNEETRTRVLEVAKKLNYHPSHLARGLARRRSENIGVVALRRYHLPFLTNPFYSRVIEGMETEVTARNYNLLLSVLPAEEPGAGFTLPKMVREKNADGLVLLGEMSDTLMAEVMDRRIPTVVVDTFHPRFEAHYVITDNRQGAKLAVEHLAGLGHRRLAFINSADPDYSFRERLAGFLEACKARDLEGKVHTMDANAASWEGLAERLLRGAGHASGVVACNDDHAIKLMQAAQKIGVKLPKEASLVGFDDIDAAAYSHPALTTVRVDKVGMGALAVKKLFSLLEPPFQKGSLTQMPVELLVRESSAAPEK